jgi:hypothetical protein
MRADLPLVNYRLLNWIRAQTIFRTASQRQPQFFRMLNDEMQVLVPIVYMHCSIEAYFRLQSLSQTEDRLFVTIVDTEMHLLSVNAQRSTP